MSGRRQAEVVIFAIWLASSCSSGAGAASKGQFLPLDYPAAAMTYATAINASGVVTGYYYTAGAVEAGFIRAADGTYTSFSIPGAVAIYPKAINASGTITGEYVTAGSLTGDTHGFVRLADGTVTPFDIDPAGYGTSPTAINDAGAVAGWWDAEARNHPGFIRFPSGQQMSFSAGGYASTWPTSINNHGLVAGWFYPPQPLNAPMVGFIYNSNHRRAPETTFQISLPGGPNGLATAPEAMNDAGVVTGYYLASGGGLHCFVRAKNGAVTSFDIPALPGATPAAINIHGVIIGNGDDPNGVPHGFMRMPSGSIRLTEPAGAVWSVAAGINDARTVVGAYDDGHTTHGFLMTP